MVGLLEPEQRVIQSLVIDLVMTLSLEESAHTGALHTSLEYASVAEQIVFIGQHGRWRLLESFSVAACRLLLAAPALVERRAQVEQASFTVRKPDALGGLATPVIVLKRDVHWARAQDGEPVMSREVLEETPMSAAYRLNLGPSQQGVLPLDMVMLVIAGSGRTADGLALQAGSRMPRDYRPAVLNAGPEGLVALLVGRPQSPSAGV